MFVVEIPVVLVYILIILVMVQNVKLNLYQGAIYFLDGQRYISNGIEINNNIGIAKIEKIDNNYPYYNKPLLEEYPEIKKIINKNKIFGLEVQQIELSIRKSVIGYVNIKIGSEERKGEKNYLDKPIRYNFLTKGIVFNAPIPQSIIKNLKENMTDFIEVDIDGQNWSVVGH